MSWRERLQRASFRGVEFFVNTADIEVQRRTVVHKFPGRETPRVQDLGKDAQIFSVSAYVIGEDYDFDRDRLEQALLKGGPGKLVHPWRGEADVEITGPIRIREGKSEQGMATIDFECTQVVSELRFTPASRPDPEARVKVAADAVNDAAETSFDENFDVSGLPAGFKTSATDALNDAATTIGDAHDQVSAQLSTVDEVSAAINEITSNGSSLIETPTKLASSMSSLVASAYASIAVPTGVARRQVELLQSSANTVGDFSDGFSAIPEKTPSRKREARNRAAMVRMVRAMSVAETARTATKIDFASRDAAKKTSDVIEARIDEVTDNAPDELFESLVSLRTASVRHLQQVASTLPELATYTPGEEMPALLLAHVLYGDAERDSELVARNGSKYPGLLPESEPLEVLSG